MAEVSSHVLHATMARIAHHHREAKAAAIRAAAEHGRPPEDAGPSPSQPAQEAPQRGK